MSRVMDGSHIYTGLVDRYRSRLPIAADAEAICLGEGATPLIRLRNIPCDLGFTGEIYVKYEGLNPTGSFKDRGMTVAVTQAYAEGSKAIICASTGNTSAAAAAYAARAGITAFVLIPEGKIALGKLAQAALHGCTIIQIRGNFDDGMTLVKELAGVLPVTVVNSVNPYRLQGQKTAAFEIIEALGDAPDYHCLPVGNAGNISAYWMGYREMATARPDETPIAPAEFQYERIAVTDKLPVMCGFQAAGAAPFVLGKPIANPETIATAIRIGNPQSWSHAETAVRESRGHFDAIEDVEILAVQKLLAEREGVFVEPASASSLAGAMRDIRSGRIKPGSRVVCTVTGHGLKDPDVAIQQASADPVTVDATRAAVEKALKAQL
jgi:threonine synthase